MKSNESKCLPIYKDELKKYDNKFDNATRKMFIGEVLRDLRVASGLTQTELCKLIDIKAGTYSTYENGTREAPAEIIVRLSILYGVSCDVILQRQRTSMDKFVPDEQFDDIDDQLDELRDELFNKDSEINPEYKNILSTLVNAFGDVTEQLREFNENAKLNDKK